MGEVAALEELERAGEAEPEVEAFAQGEGDLGLKDGGEGLRAVGGEKCTMLNAQCTMSAVRGATGADAGRSGTGAVLGIGQFHRDAEGTAVGGLVKGKDLRTCGMMGAIVAKNIIEVIGAKMDAARWEKIHSDIAVL